MATDIEEVDKLLEDMAAQREGWRDRLNASLNNPAHVAYLKKKLAEAEAGKTSDKLAIGLRLLTDLGFTAASLDQISTANQAAGQLSKPGIPAPPPLSPELSQALYEAKKNDISPVINPAKQEIQDAYQSALGQAQIGSGGQAGAYQALSNLANLQRMKSALGLAPMAQQATLQNQQNYNNLLGQRLGERQNQYENQYYAAKMGQDQYNQDAAAAGALGAAGRTNLYQTLGGLSQTLQTALPYYTKYRPFDQSTNDFMDRTMTKATMNLSPRTFQVAPWHQQQYYQGQANAPFNPSDINPDPLIQTTGNPNIYGY